LACRNDGFFLRWRRKVVTKFLAEDLLGQPQQVVDLLLSDADEEQAIICEKGPGKLHTWINHRQPVRMEPAIGFGVSDQPIALVILLVGPP